jgi:hypothetical protein
VVVGGAACWWPVVVVGGRWQGNLGERGGGSICGRGENEEKPKTKGMSFQIF